MGPAPRGGAYTYGWIENLLRLISRNRYRLPRLVDRVGMLPMEPASLLMERKMLLGVKQRAERLGSSDRRKR